MKVAREGSKDWLQSSVRVNGWTERLIIRAGREVQ